MPAGNGRSPRVLVTGAGGPSGYSFMRALREEPLDFLAGDIDPHAPGLYLVEAPSRVLLPRGDDPSFAETLFRYMIPTMGMSLEQSEQSIVLLARYLR